MYIDFTITGTQAPNDCPPENVIHISAKDASLGAHYVSGSILHFLAEKYGHKNVGYELERLAHEPALIYVDDIIHANDDDPLNPGVLIMLGADIARSMSPYWKVIFTKCIEYKK